MSPYLAEFLGTMLLIFLGNGVVANTILRGTKGENAGWIAITMGWGLAVTLAIYAVGAYSGAHINPAVTIALWVNKDFSGSLVLGYILAQMAGAFAGSVLVWVFYYSHWSRTEDAGIKLAVFSTGPAIRATGPNLISEILATMVLVMAVLFLGPDKFTQGLRPIMIGGLITSIGLSLGGTTGFALNPARDLGPRIAHFILPIPGKRDSDWSYSWIPVVGPILGGLLGSWLYNALGF